MRPNFTLLSCRRARIASIKEQCWGFPIRTLNGCSKKNDVAAGRLFHFAKGHDCIISRGEGTIYFRKRIAESHKYPK
jgi:hypothetical protein